MLKKVSFSLFAVLLISCNGLCDCTTTVGGNIYPPGETWDLAGSPYCVASSIRIYAGATLTIEPGVEIRFGEGIGMQVEGELVAIGTSGSPILFTADSDTPINDYWAYVWFDDSSVDAVLDEGAYLSGCIMEYCNVEYSGSATNIVKGAVRIVSASPFINFCSIHDNANNGIYVDSGAPIISNNTISDNDFQGLYFTYSTLDLSSNTIQNNASTSYQGGGLYMDNCSGSVASNFILDNTASGGGGVMCSYNCSPIYFSDNDISNNYSSGYGGGIFVAYTGCDISLDGDRISHNESYASGYSGGGIFAQSASYYYPTISLNKCIVDHNIATNGYGGGLYLSGTITMTDNVIAYNSARYAGGGFYLGSASNSYLYCLGNVFAENTLTQTTETMGHGMYASVFDQTTTVFQQNSFIRNYGSSSSNLGVALYNNYSGEACLMHSTVVGNLDNSTSPACAIWLGDQSTSNPLPMQYNNIMESESVDDYWLLNHNPVTTANLDATDNWWGTTSYALIDQGIWDFFDDASLGTVDVYPAAAETVTCTFVDPVMICTPPPPPTGLSYTDLWMSVDLSWDPSDISNLCGYRIYYDYDAGGFPYEGTGLIEGNSGSIEVDEITTQITLTGFTANRTYKIAVTALTAGPDDDCFSTADNMESWYSTEVLYVTVPTVTCNMTCEPSTGTVPFNTVIEVSFSNQTNYTRRAAGRMNVNLANGGIVTNWRAGWTNLSPVETFVNNWSQVIPATGSLIGVNTFTLEIEDITPAPYNQPPYPVSGMLDSDACLVEAFAP